VTCYASAKLKCVIDQKYWHNDKKLIKIKKMINIIILIILSIGRIAFICYSVLKTVVQFITFQSIGFLTTVKNFGRDLSMIISQYVSNCKPRGRVESFLIIIGLIVIFLILLMLYSRGGELNLLAAIPVTNKNLDVKRLIAFFKKLYEKKYSVGGVRLNLLEKIDQLRPIITLKYFSNMLESPDEGHCRLFIYDASKINDYILACLTSYWRVFKATRFMLQYSKNQKVKVTSYFLDVSTNTLRVFKSGLAFNLAWKDKRLFTTLFHLIQIPVFKQSKSENKSTKTFGFIVYNDEGLEQLIRERNYYGLQGTTLDKTNIDKWLEHHINFEFKKIT
jgi:hypothetical protein